MILLATGLAINELLGLLIVANSIISMIQEIWVKQKLDQLAIVG